MSYTITLSSFFWSLKTHWNQDPKLFIYIASNPCKNMLVKLDHFPRVRGENKNYSKSPPSQGMVHFNCIYWNWTCEIQNHFPRKITPLFFFNTPEFSHCWIVDPPGDCHRSWSSSIFQLLHGLVVQWFSGYLPWGHEINGVSWFP